MKRRRPHMADVKMADVSPLPPTALKGSQIILDLSAAIIWDSGQKRSFPAQTNKQKRDAP